MKQKMMTEELQQVQAKKSQQQEILRKKRQHRNEEHSNISEADLKYLERTINYEQKNTSQSNCGVSLDLSSIGLQMSDLQLLETQVQTQLDTALCTETDTAISETANVSSSMASVSLS